jgi:hypothetical protein
MLCANCGPASLGHGLHGVMLGVSPSICSKACTTDMHGQTKCMADSLPRGMHRQAGTKWHAWLAATTKLDLAQGSPVLHGCACVPMLLPVINPLDSGGAHPRAITSLRVCDEFVL